MKLPLKSLSSMLLATGAALALVAGGLALDMSPAAADGVLGITLTTLSGTPVTSGNGNTYTVEFDSPSGVAPSGVVTVDDGVGGQCTGVADNWAELGPDGGGGDDYTNSCHIESPEEAGQVITAIYSGADFGTLVSTNSLTVAAIPATLTLVGTPVASATGNDFDVELAAQNAASPMGTVTIADSVGGECQTNSWANDGAYYSANCEIGTAEAGGDTIVATYAGSDYTTTESNELTIAETSATLALIGIPTASATGNEMTAELTTSVAIAPTGTVTVSDSVGGKCQTNNWTLQGPSGLDWIYEASCAIATAEYRTDTVSATYVGTDYSTSLSNVLTVAEASSTLTISGAPFTSATGNTYTVTLDADGGLAPDGEVAVIDNAGPECDATLHGSPVPDGNGGEDYSYTCDIAYPEAGGDTVYAIYYGSDYSPAQSNTITVAAAPATLTLSGTPVPSAIGNSFAVTLEAPSALSPAGTVTVKDSSGATCQSFTWSSGVAVDGGEDYTATCVISTAETAGESVSATYAGSDYTAATSNDLTIEGIATISSASITGIAAVGDTLTAVAAGVTGSPTPTPTYQWYDDSTPISGATSSTYAVQSSDAGDSITVTITETNTGGSASATSLDTADVVERAFDFYGDYYRAPRSRQHAYCACFGRERLPIPDCDLPVVRRLDADIGRDVLDLHGPEFGHG